MPKQSTLNHGPGLGARMAQFLESVRSSLWFIPTVLVLTAVLLALALIEIDRVASDELLEHLPWLYQGGAEGARGVLSAIANSMVSVVGVTFSITIVTLVLASSQYTPRLLRNFTGDRGNKIVLGGFLATFTYALLVLRTVRGEDHEPFVPQLAVTVGVVLALACLGLFVYFIHHITHSIQASTIIGNVAAETAALIDRMYPASAETCEEEEARLPLLLDQGQVIPARTSGYLQVVDRPRLIRTATEADVVLRVEKAVGEFVTEGEPLLTVWPAGTPELCARALAAVGIGQHRTMQEDPAFGIRQLVDIAVKALSPGINDPTTALTCIDYLGSLLHRLQRRSVPSPYHTDEKGYIRLILRVPDFGEVLELSFHEIRHYGADSPMVLTRILDILTLLAQAGPDEERRDLLWRELRQTAAVADAHLTHPHDRAQINARLQAVAEALGRTPSPLLLAASADSLVGAPR